MQVHFRNSYGPKVWIAIMRYNPSSCGGEYGDWQTLGWWAINTGEEVYAFNTNNRYSAFYAEAEDGAFWAGPYGPVYVYHDAFDSCVYIGSTAAFAVVGMRLIDGNSYGTYTINLVP